MNLDRSNVGCIAHAVKPVAYSERNRARTSQDFGRIVKENLVDNPGCERVPIDCSTALNEKTGDLFFAEKPDNLSEVGSTIGTRWRELLDANASIFELTLLFGVSQ